MFHRPSPALGGAGGNESSILAPGGNHNNENLIHRLQQQQQLKSGATATQNNNNNSSFNGAGNEFDNDPSITKTPGGKGTTANRRRALGDISNKKKTTAGGGLGLGGDGGLKVSLQLGPMPSSSSTHKQPTALKPRSSNIVWEPNSINSSTTKSVLPGLSQRKQLGRTATTAARVRDGTTMIPRMSPHPSGAFHSGNSRSLNLPEKQNRSVTFSERPQPSGGDVVQRSKPLLKSSSRNALAPLSSNVTNIPKASAPASSSVVQKSNIKSSSSTKYIFQLEEPIPDIEVPAGRTWKQQLEYDLKIDDDEMASTTSIDDLLMEGLESRNMWDDWKESLWKRHQEETQKLDRIVQDEIDALLEQDKKDFENGIDGLCDTVADFHIYDDSDGDIDLGIISGDDSDDWSLPASSLCGPGAEDSFFKL